MQEYKMPIRPENSNKGTFGKVLNFAGCDNYIGAAYLSSLSALKTGAGLVALSSVNSVIDSVSKLLPEAVYLSRENAFNEIDKYTVYLIGCGFGLSKNSVNDFKKIFKLLKNTTKPIVIDADGLNILSTNKIELPQNIIITPHPMEAARLLRTEINDVLNNTEDSAKMLSQKYNAVTVLKNHRTIITNGNDIYINEHGNSALAKAGTGDVLAGIISGLLAQNCSLLEASKLGVYLHSRAGELASEELTEYSVLATDVIRFLPKAINEII